MTKLYLAKSDDIENKTPMWSGIRLIMQLTKNNNLEWKEQ